MNNFNEGFKLLDEFFGNGKDNLIALATIARFKSDNSRIRPVVRTVDAYYENGVFYVVTNAKSNKVLQIEENPEVSIACNTEMFTASGIAKNLGWVLNPINSNIRSKLRSAFASWYDFANNEQDKDCCIIAIYLQKGTLNVNHWEKLYYMDFENKTEMPDGGIK